MEDFNAYLGKNDSVGHSINGKLVQARKIMEEQDLLTFELQMIKANSFFQQPKWKSYTQKSPGDVHRNQIDYIIIEQRQRESTVQVTTYPGAEINSDKNPVIYS